MASKPRRAFCRTERVYVPARVVIDKIKAYNDGARSPIASFFSKTDAGAKAVALAESVGVPVVAEGDMQRGDLEVVFIECTHPRMRATPYAFCLTTRKPRGAEYGDDLVPCHFAKGHAQVCVMLSGGGLYASLARLAICITDVFSGLAGVEHARELDSLADALDAAGVCVYMMRPVVDPPPAGSADDFFSYRATFKCGGDPPC